MLEAYVDAWRDTTGRLLELLDGLTPEQWAAATALPGWDVRTVASHVAHLEAVVAGLDPDAAQNPEGASLVSDYTQRGVDARAALSPADVVAELRAAVETRSAQLDPAPGDPKGTPDRTPGRVPWDWQTLLRNRVVDTWVHEQDVRDAVGLPGGEDAPGAHVTTHSLVAGMPFVLGRKVRARPGTSVRWILTDAVPLAVTSEIGDDGRARPAEVVEPTATLTLSSQDFVRLAAGRRDRHELDVAVLGDRDLAARVLDAANILF